MDEAALFLRQHLADLSGCCEGQADLGIGRAGDAGKHLRRDQGDLYTHAPQFLDRVLDGADHAIDLRSPGIRHNRDLFMLPRPFLESALLCLAYVMRVLRVHETTLSKRQRLTIAPACQHEFA